MDAFFNYMLFIVSGGWLLFQAARGGLFNTNKPPSWAVMVPFWILWITAMVGYIVTKP